ncbi:MAG: alkaline phosphatase PhoX [Sphingobium sp.]
MNRSFSRRQVAAGLTGAAFGGLALYAGRAALWPDAAESGSGGYGPLKADPAGLLDLPEGFSYNIVSAFGDRMDDGLLVPDSADGMGCFPLGGGRIALVRNHELRADEMAKGPAGKAGLRSGPAYDHARGAALPGGTTTIVLNAASLKVEAQYLSLAGTIRNCAGGITPWGSWLTCEEDVTRAGQDGVARDHGWVFEVPAMHKGLVTPVALTGLGRFRHEAACIDPATGIVYLTEDRDEGLFYRFLPNEKGALAKGGRLQALALVDGLSDTRNWDESRKAGQDFAPHHPVQARWIDLDGTDSPDDDLRLRGAKAGAAMFARAEGIWFGAGEAYFCCTSGGAAGFGQVMRYRPSSSEGQAGEKDEPGVLELFLESPSGKVFNYGDNLTVAPNGHLIVCEDQYTTFVDNHLRGITPRGEVYTFARLRSQTELAGACFSPDGQTLFVNHFHPAKTLAIRGPWAKLAA